MNEYDSARMYDVLRESKGYERADNEADADVLLLNTCSIREKAQEKVFHQLGRWQKLKAERSDLVIGVGGLRSQSGRRRYYAPSAGSRYGIWSANDSSIAADVRQP